MGLYYISISSFTGCYDNPVIFGRLDLSVRVYSQFPNDVVKDMMVTAKEILRREHVRRALKPEERMLNSIHHEKLVILQREMRKMLMRSALSLLRTSHLNIETRNDEVW